MTEYQIHTLPNGIRVAHRQVPYTQIVHCGLMLDMGSRDEKPNQLGLAHFWEHMAFKGTKKRKSYHIINRLESVGGELNAYTTKEKICFYASVLDAHFEKSVELLADITFDSVFPENQIEKERGVILEEMSMYQDSPEDALQDDFDEIVFANHQLGANILGTQESVKGFTRKELQDFIAENMDTEKIVMSIVGNIPFQKAIKIAEKYLKDIPAKKSDLVRVPPTAYQAQRITTTKKITQAHCAIGRPSYSMSDEHRLPFFMLVNLFGGPGMNSRLNMTLREKYGLVYGIDATYSPFTDTGFFGIYFATDKSNLDKANSLILKEMQILKDKPLGKLQLHTVKEQLMGQLAMAEESNQSFMLMMAKSILDIGKVESLESIFADIKNIEAADLQEITKDMFDETQLSYLTFLPE
ncbi:peptidase M16 domain protein [Emticicia oligotrophica DSM 17448]|uniref:Peptidase M16 domain protein n=1 Tax=Emticicia oligotrophica (strain DSM 17448 / CIP 109782 / MTCC 6937 / GPTSA100-15) TaxID=929562 RepID=A0ABN4AN32_EMTOG|nr:MULTISPECIES: pitrilysin family protein [Emticicia]AFK03566.1 peptidase M16 domain protein [Emticicia oligotrophica DSM 17448]